MVIEVTGEYTTARVLADEALVEADTLDQLQELVDHPAFTEPVRVMPDTHPGAGVPVGFTMPVSDRIVPSVVGVDVGCGIAATELGAELPLAHAERERRVREAVPMGRTVNDYDDAPHLIDQFPFDRANRVFEGFAEQFERRFGRQLDPQFPFDGYDGAYVKSMCDRVLARQSQGIGHVIRSAGTLGGGNHFVEFAQARESGDYWLVIHSGSRYLGKSVAEYWQREATTAREADAIRDAVSEYAEYVKFDPETVSDADCFAWVTGGKGESHVRRDRVRADFAGEEREKVLETVAGLREAARDVELAALEDEEADGYYVDMLFAQQYARWNRELMSEAICEALGVEPTDQFQSVHNYVDFQDLTIRKGATPAREGQRLVVPFDMANGSVLARGKGNATYNDSAPHGAGRAMSRRRATEELSTTAFVEAMDGVYSESVGEATLDEAPMAYKPADAIREAIRPTAEVIDWLEPVHNLKATE
ncbi:MAG: RtcB family protein [Halobaculum sp.]